MSFVLDASIAVCWAFKDEVSPTAQSVLNRIRSDGAFVPLLAWFEIRNGLLMSERRGRIAEADTHLFLKDVGRLAINVDHRPDEIRVLTLARRHKLTIYDAAYLELAQRMNCPLATLDSALAAAARSERVALIEDEK